MSVTRHYLHTTANLDMAFQRMRRERKPRVVDGLFFRFGNVGRLRGYMHAMAWVYWPPFRRKVGQYAFVDLRVIPLLKDLGFIDEKGKPTPRYELYRRDPSGAGHLYDGIREAYEGLFRWAHRPQDLPEEAISEAIADITKVEKTALQMARTFLALCDVADRSTVFRAFDPEAFLPWPVWKRLRKILTGNGGCYGLSGPRGSGKSWLMQKAIQDAESQQGLGVWFPSPSEYQPEAFLTSLADTLGRKIQENALSYSTGMRRLGRTVSWRTALLLPLLIGAVVFGVLYILYRLLVGNLFYPTVLGSLYFYLVRYGVLWTPFLAAGCIAFLVLSKVRYALSDWGRLDARARRMSERLRFSITERRGSEMGATAGKGFVGALKSSMQRELVERPLTMSALVDEFRDVAQATARVCRRVVIAVDELDKMEDPIRVRRLLRDVKAILRCPACTS
jgi:hypothetical protein